MYLSERPLVSLRDVLHKELRVRACQGRKEERHQQNLEVATSSDQAHKLPDSMHSFLNETVWFLERICVATWGITSSCKKRTSFFKIVSTRVPLY